jgi:tripartite-type tricarboxylate transporter receptor subunit TctC
LKTSTARTSSSKRQWLRRAGRLSTQGLALSVASALPAKVWAQAADKPLLGDRPIRFILPVSAGSGVDGIVRSASVALGRALGTNIIVENQPGAGGVIGTQNLIRSAPDGLTLSVVSNNHVIYPSVLKQVPFDPVNDIAPIAVIGATPLVLAINPKVPAKDLKEFVALLKAKPGKYNYGSSCNGTILHLAAELFKEVTQTFSTHIPYRGFGPMLQDLMAGQIDWGVGALPAMQGQIKAGAIRALCVSAPARIPAAADLPTAIEQGYPKYLVEGWFAVIGPKGLPADKIKHVQEAFSAAFSTPEVKAAMARQGNTINIGSTEAAGPFFKAEMARYGAIVKRAGIVPE